MSLKNHVYYIGSTRNLDKRIKAHNKGKSRYTRLIKPLELVFAQKYETYNQARKAEIWLKRQKDRNLIEKLIKDKVLNKLFVDN